MQELSTQEPVINFMCLQYFNVEAAVHTAFRAKFYDIVHNRLLGDVHLVILRGCNQ